MKTKSCSLVLLIAMQLHLVAATEANEDYVAHEWGTFTSVQGADGILLEWNPLVTTELPSFVYDYKKPSGDSRRQLVGFGGKAAIRTLQRMETPVIYFYSGQERSVDVTVRFPEGRITEWFPQARDIGPSIIQPRPLLQTLDNAADQIGLSGINLSAIDTKRGIAESLIRWPQVKVLPMRDHAGSQQLVPSDPSGSHYYAARATDADLLRVSARVNDTAKPEHEKFLFYRGVGSFKTPLHVSGDGEQSLSLRNTGSETLSHLFVLQVRNGQGNLISAGSLAPGKDQAISLPSNTKSLPISELVHQITDAMRTALVKEGLYEREAKAMVDTWRDSWFEEQGVRVLYLLPRSWTDRVLPLTLDPPPREIVRVMVGRAEVITPAMEWDLLKEIVRYSQMDASSRGQVVLDSRKLGLGRFLEPAMRRLMRKLPSGEFNKLSSQFLEAAAKENKPAGALAQK